MEVSEMERIPRGIYTRELREEAVKLVIEGGESLPEVGRRLSIAPSTIRYWVKASKEGKLHEVGRQQKPLTELEMELARVKRELAIVKMERDILKKRPRTLRRSRCQVRDDKTDATVLCNSSDEHYAGGICKRVLPVVEP
jgi:transposase-like protein